MYGFVAVLKGDYSATSRLRSNLLHPRSTNLSLPT